MPRDASKKEIITVAAKVYMIAGDGTLRNDTQASGSIGLDFERHEFRGAGRRLTAAEQLSTGSVREPARPETAGQNSIRLDLKIDNFPAG
jgi:hypothetical protein